MQQEQRTDRQQDQQARLQQHEQGPPKDSGSGLYKAIIGDTSLTVGDHESRGEALAAIQAKVDRNPVLQAAAAKAILTQTPKSHPEMWRLIQSAGRYIQVLPIQEQQDVINAICQALKRIELKIFGAATYFYEESLAPLLQIKCAATQELKTLLRKRIYKAINTNEGLPEIQRLDAALCVAHALGMENLVEEVGFLKQQFLEASAKDAAQRGALKMQRRGVNGLYFKSNGGIQKINLQQSF